MKVIIADDHRIVRDGLRLMVETQPDIEVIAEASDGAELLGLLADSAVDVVLLDIRMPGLNGLDALEKLHATAPGTRVLILTMHDEPAYVRRAIELGASGYLLKSADREELLAALRTVDRGGSYLQTELTPALLRGIRSEGSGVSLTPREQTVLQLAARGLENKQIAHELDISESTVKTHLRRIFAGLDVSSRTEAVAVATKLGIID